MTSKWFELDLADKPVEEVTPQKTKKAERSRNSQKKRVSTRSFIAGAGTLITAVVGISLWQIIPASSTADVAAESPVITADPVPASRTTPPVPEREQAGTNCSGESTVEPGRESLQEAVVAFQTAYHSHDASGVLDVVAPESSMAAENWDELLPLAAPEGTTWCLHFTPHSETTVATDLTVTDPAGASVLYAQLVTGSQRDGAWIIEKITERVDENA